VLQGLGWWLFWPSLLLALLAATLAAVGRWLVAA